MKQTFKQPTKLRVLLIIFLSFVFVISVIGIFYDPSISSYIIFPILMLLSVYVMINVILFKIESTNEALKVYGLSLRIIYYSQIMGMMFTEKEIIVWSESITIHIPKSVERLEELIFCILGKIENKYNLIIEGDREIARKYGLTINSN